MAVNVNVNFWGVISCSLLKGANISDDQANLLQFVIDIFL